MSRVEFDLAGPLPHGRTALEASAGTGKTYSLTGLVARYIVEDGVPVDQILVVTFTRAAANELRDRTRAVLGVARRALDSGEAPPDQAWMAALLNIPPGESVLTRQRRLDEALARFDELSITTIHGFCQQSLVQLGLRSGSNPDAVLVENLSSVVAEVCRDTIVATLAAAPALLNATSQYKTIANPKQAETELIAAVQALMSNPGATLAPADAGDELAARWFQLVRSTRDAVTRRQQTRGEIGYDTLISGLQQALAHPVHGAAVAQQLAQRYSVVLVDEFQDTDRYQWDVFQRAFGAGNLITVGDPKQAIYRFRGADVHAYLEAVRDAPLLSLATNHRSDSSVLAGLAQLFDGATLGDAAIAFAPVTAAPSAPITALARADGTPVSASAIEVRVVPPYPSLQTKTGRDLAMPLVRSLVLADLVEQVIDLLDNANVSTTRVEPGNIAILVPSHLEANNVAEAMRRAGVPAVRTRTGSVLFTAAAEQWRLLLAALAQPHHAPTVRAAALGWFLATDVTVLDTSDDTLAALQEQAAHMADRMRTAGLGAFYDEQKSGPTLLPVVLSRQGGDRELTDLDHVAELLADATHGSTAEPGQVLRVLDEMITGSDDRGEAAMRRIDSDALAVQITTIHSAKGLEWPIVLVPFSFKPRSNARTPWSFISPDGQRTLDLASPVAWEGGFGTEGDETTRYNQEARRHWSIVDTEGDELRLLYVALTRAMHRVVIWWASAERATTSALGRILLDRFVAGPVENSQGRFVAKPKAGGFKVDRPAYQDFGPKQAADQIELLTTHSDGTIGRAVLAEHIPPPRWTGRDDALRDELEAAETHGRAPLLDRSWQRWSFSRLGSTLESMAVGAMLDQVDRNEPIPEHGGVDEPAEADDEFTVRSETSDQSRQLQLGVGPTAHLADIAGGTRFGTFVHAVLEQLDFTSPDLITDIRSSAAEQARRDGLDLPLDTVAAGLAAAVGTPLGPLFHGRSLAAISPADRLPELTFDFPIATRMTAGRIGDVMLATLHPSDRLRPFASRLAREFRGIDMSGWMHGSIDAVFRIEAEGDHRYFIVDYKTNRLHRAGADDPVAAYHPVQLVAAMEHSRYPLQALLYNVALHRYLRSRLGASYVPHDHLGGIGYLFVRGMVGPDTPAVRGVPHGVFSWRPPTTTVLEIDRLFTEDGPP